MLFQNLLVPVDLSKQSTRAFKIATDISKKYGSKITVITCIKVGTDYPRYYQSSTISQQIKEQSEIIENHFKELDSFARKNNVSLKFKILKSETVVKDITSFTKSKKHDLIVMGSHGRKGFDKLLLGSVANGVSQKANCSVMIVK